MVDGERQSRGQDEKSINLRGTAESHGEAGSRSANRESFLSNPTGSLQNALTDVRSATKALTGPPTSEAPLKILNGFSIDETRNQPIKSESHFDPYGRTDLEVASINAFKASMGEAVQPNLTRGGKFSEILARNVLSGSLESLAAPPEVLSHLHSIEKAGGSELRALMSEAGLYTEDNRPRPARESTEKQDMLKGASISGERQTTDGAKSNSTESSWAADLQKAVVGLAPVAGLEALGLLAVAAYDSRGMRAAQVEHDRQVVDICTRPTGEFGYSAGDIRPFNLPALQLKELKQRLNLVSEHAISPELKKIYGNAARLVEDRVPHVQTDESIRQWGDDDRLGGAIRILQRAADRDPEHAAGLKTLADLMSTDRVRVEPAATTFGGLCQWATEGAAAAKIVGDTRDEAAFSLAADKLSHGGQTPLGLDDFGRIEKMLKTVSSTSETGSWVDPAAGRRVGEEFKTYAERQFVPDLARRQEVLAMESKVRNGVHDSQLFALAIYQPGDFPKGAESFQVPDVQHPVSIYIPGMQMGRSMKLLSSEEMASVSQKLKTLADDTNRTYELRDSGVLDSPKVIFRVKPNESVDVIRRQCDDWQAKLQSYFDDSDTKTFWPRTEREIHPAESLSVRSPETSVASAREMSPRTQGWAEETAPRITYDISGQYSTRRIEPSDSFERRSETVSRVPAVLHSGGEHFALPERSASSHEVGRNIISSIAVLAPALALGAISYSQRDNGDDRSPGFGLK